MSRKRREIETCCVADQFCTSAANFEEPSPIKGICFSCGQKVCPNCSTKRKYLRYGIRRVCNDCQIHVLDGGSDYRVMMRLHRLAGYKGVTFKKGYEHLNAISL